MNINPEQIPDEVVEAACAALAVAMEFGDTWPGDYAEEQQNELRQAIRQTLAAALPALLGEPVAFSVRSADGELSKLGFFPMDHFDATKRLAVLREGWHYVFAHHVAETTLPTQDTPNAE